MSLDVTLCFQKSIFDLAMFSEIKISFKVKMILVRLAHVIEEVEVSGKNARRKASAFD